jgi:sulfatase modifying factor 1
MEGDINYEGMIEHAGAVRVLVWLLRDMFDPVAAAVCLTLTAAGWLLLGGHRLLRVDTRRSGVVLLAVGAALLVGVTGLVAALLSEQPLSMGRLYVWVRQNGAVVLGAVAAAAIVHCTATWLRSRSALHAVGVVALLLAAVALYAVSFGDLEEILAKQVWQEPEESRYAGNAVAAQPTREGMVYIPPGPFVQGSISPHQTAQLVGGFEGDERPVRSRYLPGFFIDRYEVTNAEFARFVEATGYVTDAERLDETGRRLTAEGWIVDENLTWREPFFPGDSIADRPNHPVVQVSWNDAVAFCAWRGARLPTEAEWEKAARGPDGRAYPWGDEFDPKKANYCDSNCNLPQVRDDGDDGYEYTAPVGSFPEGRSVYGVDDMAGNVWEWVQDLYDPYYYYYAPSIDPRGPTSSRLQLRVVRGGSFAMRSGYLRTSSRSYDPPHWGFFGVGFRCAADP